MGIEGVIIWKDTNVLKPESKSRLILQRLLTLTVLQQKYLKHIRKCSYCQLLLSYSDEDRGNMEKSHQNSVRRRVVFRSG